MPVDPITNPNTINPSGAMINFVRMLRKQSLPRSLYGQSRQTPRTRRMENGRVRVTEAPSEIFIDISDKFSGGNIVVNLEFLAALSEEGASGNEKLRGNSPAEEPLVFKFFRATANMRRKGVPLFGDGPSAHQLKVYIDKKGVNDQLSQWASDDVELGIRHGLFEGVCPYLEAAPSGLTPKLHPKIWCAGDTILDSDQPIYNYDTNMSNYGNVIGTQCQTIPTGTQGGISFKNLAKLEEVLAVSRTRKLELSRGPGWIISMSNRGYNQMINDPKIQEILEHADVRGPDNQLLSNVKGPVCGIYFWVDDRLPRLSVTGTGPYTVAGTYYGHGITDNRLGDFDINIIHGPGAILRGNCIAPHFRNDTDDYGIVNGIAVSRTDSIMRPQFDDEVPGPNTNEVDGSFIFLTRRTLS